MRASYLIVLTVLGWVVQFSACRVAFPELQRRQDTTETGFPTLTTETADVATISATVESNSLTSAARTTTARTTTGSTEQTSTTKPSFQTTSADPTPSSTIASSYALYGDELPLEPKITPALGIAGALLVIFGAINALIGVKNRLTQIFLSCGFLASIGATMLVEYVMSPPVSDAVQGGFFVAIFMAGVVFGGGALVFKEITAGFGCLLGGFCFAMWLLTLEAGGTVTSAAGKGAFIGVFCAAAWALSFSKLTKPYALIGSTAFGGATAFTLGIDCFTRAGLKEFWLYIWNLNDNLFPLNTNTYPLTKGIKVEIAVIVIVTIIGVLSQIRLWNVIRSKELNVEAVQQQDEQQKDAVEEALGRYLERQNEREKSAWERHYGDRLNSKRNTLLWQDRHSRKRQSTVSIVPVDKSTPSTSSESLEMNAFGPQKSSSTYGSKTKRQSSVTVDVIEEVEEDDDTGASLERQKALQALESPEESLEEAIKISNVLRATKSKSIVKEEEVDDAPSVVQPEKESPGAKLKRRSQRSISGLTKRLTPGYRPLGSKSKEQLIDIQRPSSRASSAAATLDEDDEELGAGLLETDGDDQIYNKTPDIVISSAASDAPEFGEASYSSAKTSIAGDHAPPLLCTARLESQADSDGFELQVLTSSAPESTETSERASKEDREGGRTGSSRSQLSGTSNTSAESLTKTALAQMPSQASTVVLSYRTNEWAKHIASADEPMYDEPESYGVDEELPTHVSTTSAPTSAPSSIRAGRTGVGITSQSVAGHRSFSDPDRRRSAAKPPSRSVSMQSLKVPGTRGSRASFNPSASTSLVKMPIVENVPTEFAASKPSSISSRRASGGSPYNLPPSQRASATRLAMTSMRPSSSGSAGPYAGSVYELAQTSRFPSQQFFTPGTTTPYQQFHTPGTTTPMGTNGRRVSYESQQSLQRQSSIEALNRESLHAQWRLSQQVRMSRGGIVDPAAAEAEHRRAKMKAEKDNQRRLEEYQRIERMRKQATMDQLMRRPDMQDLHREAMRKMQANANKKLRKSVG
ncbi:hypothetical protein EDD36DRAFT_417882 [Exophiala viscosa]|uniref:TM7S3/TM198-like domain-containing protein n=1 Tax=Exophiala viscosa TaxID=2486360 RepID=A0AAN6IE31_9EURO|nr:hypothetical protein EDD36DRAFT_417882 [Exophiala viscosa]